MEVLEVVTVDSGPGQAPSARRLHAFIDEAGVRSHSRASGDHFVMSAVVVADANMVAAQQFLAKLREDLGRRPGDTLHWVNLKKHEERVHAAKSLGAQEWATIANVIVCKRHLPGGLDEKQAYLYTLRFLLERLSWFARDLPEGPAVLTYTLAHIVRMQIAHLRQYEAALQAQPTQIAWSALDPKGGKMDQPKRIEMLQCADLAASAAFAAFNADRFGNTERRYLEELAGRLYRRGAGSTCLTSYGMKMHPWNGNTKAAYPWVAAL
ncbi:DUF3800 domain-containing protein [Streptomyces sp. NPDC047070]|uniref:DUF3800 domain-containing protein n=1 Tax=Streptomyces sp. NPDC047070 TaxID=3154923 RepID=UPI0034564F9D